MAGLASNAEAQACQLRRHWEQAEDSKEAFAAAAMSEAKAAKGQVVDQPLQSFHHVKFRRRLQRIQIFCFVSRVGAGLACRLVNVNFLFFRKVGHLRRKVEALEDALDEANNARS